MGQRYTNRRSGRWLGLGVFTLSLAAGEARANEPRPANEPMILAEPAEITQVVDAFDEHDQFDLNLTLGFSFDSRSATILRESSIVAPGLSSGGYTNPTLNVADYSETTSRLHIRADVGLFHDIALILRMPVILANNRELTSVDGSGDAASGTIPLALAGAPGERLFNLPFKSPTRSGIEYIAAGLDFGIMNQSRNYTQPTWVFGFEGRFDVSEPMRACNENPAGGQVQCAHPSDINRNGVPDPGNPDGGPPDDLEGQFTGTRDPGVSRGVTGLELHTYVSKRIKYVEPYGGFKTLFEFQLDSSDYGITDLQGSLVNHPPLRGSLIMGVNVIPWEVRERYQRVTLDFRFEGSYVSEGRDYTELFDALGSSDASSLRQPNFAQFQEHPGLADEDPDALENPSVVNPNSEKVYFTGLTDVQQHGQYRLSTQFTWQAGEYVKFNLGGGLTIVQGHFITFDQACNPDFSSSIGEAGPCRNTLVDSNGTRSYDPSGIPNPNYRKTVNDPGMRYKVDDSSGLDAWVNATVMF